MLERVFDCKTTSIDCDYTQHDIDVASAIRETKNFLTTGQSAPILVKRGSNGRYKVQTNAIAFLVAHVLSIPTVKVQEVA